MKLFIVLLCIVPLMAQMHYFDQTRQFRLQPAELALQESVSYNPAEETPEDFIKRLSEKYEITEEQKASVREAYEKYNSSPKEASYNPYKQTPDEFFKNNPNFDNPENRAQVEQIYKESQA